MADVAFQSTDSGNPNEIQSYFRATRTATWGFLMALPLLILYEVGIVWVNSGRSGVIRISSESVLKSLFSTFGLTHELLLLGVTLILGIAIMIWERKKKVAFSIRYPGLMILESSVYAVLLAFFVSGLTALMLSPLMILQEEQSLGLAMNLVLSLGAGIYEELLFRVILVGGLFWLLKKIFPDRTKLMYIVAAVIGALSFSFVHHIGNMGDPWTLDVFLYRTIFGLVFNVVFLIRGFAIVAWTHAIYDVMVVTGFFSLLRGG